MKNKKRNITMIAVLVFVCAAVALNWSYNNRWGHPDSEMVSAEDSAMLDAAAADAEATSVEESPAIGYFDEARLTRETIDSAINAISAMAACSMKEAQIENLLLAKDFSECVVYISNDSITVAVPAPAEGLSEEAVARITDVICTETEYDASQLNIIEVKA